MNQVIDFSTLTWVKHELDETLRDARQALESHVENPTDPAQLGFLSAHLHQVYGTLQMVELYGASLLAEEMEYVARAIASDSVSKHDDACEVLMRAILQLPDYLDRLIAGYRDIPVVLLPILNDLRAVRGETLLSDNAMFSPNLSAALPDEVARKTNGGDIQAAAKDLRHRFQLGLLGWLRGRDSGQSLEAMAAVVQELLGMSETEELSRLLWVAHGIIETLKDETLESTVAVKRLFGQMDREIKRLYDLGETAVSQEPALDLFKNLLFYAGQSKGGGPTISLVKSVYSLSDLLPGEAEVAAARESMSGQNADLFATVSAAIKEELARLKDSLDLVLRSGSRQAEEFNPLIDSLSSLGDTLGMLSLDAPRKAMLEKAADLRHYSESGGVPPEPLIMDIASTLLFVESSVDGLGAGRPADSNETSINEQIAKSEYDHVMEVVLQEAIADLTRGKEAIISYAESQLVPDHLDTVPQLFNQVKGGLLLLGETRAAGLTGSISKYIENELLTNKKQPHQKDLESLADSICGLEYYLEGRRENRMFGGAAMNVAEQSVQKLGYPSEKQLASPRLEEGDSLSEPVGDNVAASASEGNLPGDENDRDSSVPDGDSSNFSAETVEVASMELDGDPMPRVSETVNYEGVEQVSPEPAEAPPTTEQDDINVVYDPEPLAYMESKSEGGSIGVEECSTAVQPLEELLNEDLPDQIGGEEPIQSEVPREESISHGGSKAADSESEITEETMVASVQALEDDEREHLAIIGTDTDDEILEIFLEEAEEEIESINRQLPDWAADPENAEALRSVRRSYHTLKGSGRLVGAMRIGEFAWAYENMLNKLIEGVVSVSPSMLQILDAASRALPALVQEVKDGARVTQPIAYLMRCAEALSKGEPMPDAPIASAVPESPSAPETQPVEPADLDTDVAYLVHEMPPHMETVEVVEQRDENTHAAVAGPVEDVEIADDSVMDAMLYEIFSAESRGHLEVIRQYLNRVASGDAHVDEVLARALHTLHGSAHMANAHAIAELSGELEKFVKALLSAGLPMPDAGCDVLQRSAEMTELMLESLPMELTTPEQYDAVMEAVRGLRTAVPSPKADALVVEGNDEQAANDSLDNSPGEDEDGLAQAAEEQAYSTCDEELLNIFLEESQENLEICEAALLRWRDVRDDAAATAELQRALHTLKGGARMADLEQIADVAHAVESLVMTITDGRSKVSDAALDGIQRAHDTLVLLLEQVTDRVPLEDQRQLISDLFELQSNNEEASHSQRPGCADEQGDKREAAPLHESALASESSDQYVDIDPELLEVFLEEAVDILEHSDETLRNWARSPDDPACVAEFQRELHTLKGGARMADITDIGDLAHAVESLTVKIADGELKVVDSIFGVLHQAHDKLSDMVERVKARQPLSQAIDVMQALTRLLDGEEANSAPLEMSEPEQAHAVSADKPARKKIESEDRRSKERAGQELVRVKAKLLDNMVNYAGEVSIYRSRLEQKIGAYRFNLVEMEQTISRLREQLRKLEIETEAQILFRYETENINSDDQFDPLEMDRYSHMQQLSRSLVESVSDLGSIQNLLENLTGESETLLLQQSRVNTELQEGLMRTRMVPFLGLAARMRRIVRQTCQTVGKKAELELSGAEGEMDRTVVDRIVAPIEHMLRNAISHGIEGPQQRLAAGKPESGTIRITLERESSDVVLRIADDGAGIDLKAIREKAIERGMMARDSGISDDQALQFILETGFSTAEKVTQVAGRGVGMDVVNSEVKQLGGSLHIASEKGKGTTFTMRLPFTLALNQALLVEVGEDTYAVPLSSIEGIVRMRREDIACYYEDKDLRFSYGGFEYQVSHLGSLLGTGKLHLDSGPKRVPVLLARVGDQCVAFQVENLMGSREIVVKSVGPQISTVRGVSGATILGDGRVVMILDLVALLRGGLYNPLAQVEDMMSRPSSSKRLTVMVVDDSITVRKVTTRLLERNEMNVISAKDGVDAVAKLQENIPDIMLLDIEMPRMDGFELATHVRNEARLRDIPIIMITSRTGDKHRQRAMQIGVNRYLGKPFQETDLLENIQGLLQERQGK